jgi:uncharacterized membrane protein (DUF485 family)
MSQHTDSYLQIRNNPKFISLVAKRNRYSFIMTSLMMIVYFGYILLIAFNKEWLATKVAPGMVMTIGIPMGLGVILFTIIITIIYVRRANTEFDTEAAQVLKEAQK